MRFAFSTFLRLYVTWAVSAAVTGWMLSALHALNFTGYVILFPITVACLAWLTRSDLSQRHQFDCRSVLLKRFKRPLPFLFLLAAVCAFVGGTLYAPNNYDGLTYRLPRMLNWLSSGGWHWISTSNMRMNYAGTGWEWMALPLFIFKTDRFLFLINAIGFLLLPGLLFSIFRNVGISSRVAWHWMWLLPMAYGIASQAGSIGNDISGVIFALISIYFGLRARRSRQIQDVWLCGLAAAVLSAIKLSNLPLLLPCIVAVWPALETLKQRTAKTLGVIILAVVASAVPTMILNQTYCGCWSGDPQNIDHLKTDRPDAAIAGNTILIAEQAITPPVIWNPTAVNTWSQQHLPDTLRHLFQEGFPRFFNAQVNELSNEESAGIGLGITTPLVLAAIVTAIGFQKKKMFQKAAWIGTAAWIAAAVYASKLVSESTGRLMLPYYPLLMLPFLAMSAQNKLLQFKAWKILLIVAAATTFPILILTPSRPLWPAVSGSQHLHWAHPSAPLFQRMSIVYSTYEQRNDALAPLRKALPDDVRTIGFIGGPNDTDYSLWRPFGMRQVIQIVENPNGTSQIPPEIHWIIVHDAVWDSVVKTPLETWVEQHHGKTRLKTPIITLVSSGPETWSLMHIEN